MKEKVSWKKILEKSDYFLAVLIPVLFILLSLTVSFNTLENKYYDTYLTLKKDIPENDGVALLAIDDTAIEEIGHWPWGRNILGDVLIRLRELGARGVVFDIEYLNPSQIAVNPQYINEELPAEYQTVKNEITSQIGAFSEAIQNKQLPTSSAIEIGTELNGMINPMMDDLYDSISHNVFRDNDAYFAKALAYFGSAYIPINTSKVNTTGDDAESIKYVYESVLHSNIEDPSEYIKRDNKWLRERDDKTYGLGPAILSFANSSVGGGFPNVIIDADGVRRRIELLSEYEGKYVAQLVLEPLLDIYQPEKLVRAKHSLTLVNARDLSTENGRKNIVIPLDEHGNLLINWIKKNFNESFKANSVYFLYYIDRVEETLIEHIKNIQGLNIRTAEGYLGYYDATTYLLDQYEQLQVWKQELFDKTRDDFDDYFAQRTSFFADLQELIDGGFDKEIYAVFDAVRESAGDSTLYKQNQENIENQFKVFSADYKLYNDEFTRLTSMYKGVIGIVGYSGLGTTDLGVNPFYESYANTGTHANIFNTIVSEAFIKPVPSWVSWLVALVLCLIFAFVVRKTEKLSTRIILGVAFIGAIIIILFGIFALWHIYLKSLIIILAVFVQFLVNSLLKFFLAEKEKGFLRKAFSTYLSADIINEIIKDPSRLSLGGEEKEVTALFTDIKAFSTLSEKVTPTELVAILNKYLTAMSDIVLAERGTIDKYIGDAIVAFFGAPIPSSIHAREAFISAIRMKQVEAELNKTLLETGEAPMPLLTRIGINTGRMVVGNMGTENKMNYTIMGNDVNLAARLEGVNKYYGTWILASQASMTSAGEGFLCRRLDRTRVVGINEPVQLYEVVGLLDECSAQLQDSIALFHTALDLYLKQDFKKAIELFRQVLEQIKDDPPSLLYIERCEKYLTQKMPDDWDGVVNMLSK